MMKRFFRSNATWSLVSNGVTAILGFGNLGLIAHNFSKADAGKWFMLLTVYTLLELVRSGWVQSPFVRFYTIANSSFRRAKLIAASWQLLLLFTMLFVAIGLPLAYLLNIQDNAFSLARRFTPLWLLAALPYQLLQWQLQAKMLFKKLALTRLLFPLAFTALLLAQLRLKLDIETLALCYAALQFIAGFAGICAGWLKFGRWFTKLKQERKDLSNFGRYSMLTMLAASLLRSSDQFIIALCLGPSAVAVYSLPQKLIEAIEIPVRSMASVAIPNATVLWHNNQIAELKRFFYSQCGLLMTLILPLIAIFLAWPSKIIDLLGGAKYQESALLLQLFCLYASFIPIDRYCGVLLDAGNQPRKNSIKVMGMLLTNVLLDVLALASGFGIYGVAAASTITFLTGVIIGWVQLKNILGVFQPRLFWSEGIAGSIKSLKRAPLTL